MLFYRSNRSITKTWPEFLLGVADHVQRTDIKLYQQTSYPLGQFNPCQPPFLRWGALWRWQGLLCMTSGEASSIPEITVVLLSLVEAQRWKTQMKSLQQRKAVLGRGEACRPG